MIYLQLRSVFVVLSYILQLGLSPLLFCEDDADEREEHSTPACAAEQSLQKETDGLSKRRLCSLQKGPLGFGFNLGCVPQKPGTFISQVGMKHQIAFSQRYFATEAKMTKSSRSEF